MTKWDTIQADVADMYTGINETQEWEKGLKEDQEFLSNEYITADDLFDQDDLVLGWED